VRSDVHQTKHIAGVGLKLAVYVASGTLVGASVGAALGWIGSAIAPEVRAVIVVCFAFVALLISLTELFGRRVRMIQVDRETPYGWLGPGPLSWAARNGAAIGFGGGTRLGFWLWYVVPLGSLLAGSPILGAAAYGLYSLSRTLSAGGIIVMVQRASWTASHILDKSASARANANLVLLALALTALVIVGS
jgi:hypothetical protein